MKAALRYFTGTGNTRRCMAVVGDMLENAGWEVDGMELDLRPSASPQSAPQSSPQGGDGEILVLAFPVLGFSAPQAVRSWAASLPKVPGGSAVAAAVCGSVYVKGRIVPGYGGRAAADVARILRRRGYRTIGCREVSYPENWTQVSNPAGGEEKKALLDYGDGLSRELARAILEGRFVRLARPADLPLGLVAPMFRLLARRVLGALFVADRSCTGCGLCVRTCPVGAVRLSEGRKRPRWLAPRCQGCNRCINICPAASIQSSPFKTAFHLAFQIGAGVAAVRLGGALPLPQGFPAAPALRIAASCAAFAVLAAFELGPLETFLGILGRTEAGAALFSAGAWTRSFRRYQAPPLGTE